jgi:putative ubiquitin-RnfH superfamily antitoxin RatB of RatAB toxin-antitoxin module
MSVSNNISIEIVYAIATRQVLLEMSVRQGTTIGQAIERSAIADMLPGENLSGLPVGVWGKLADRHQLAVAGDRIELYRPLLIDPREARRSLAAEGRSMGPARSASR